MEAKVSIWYVKPNLTDILRRYLGTLVILEMKAMMFCNSLHLLAEFLEPASKHESTKK